MSNETSHHRIPSSSGAAEQAVLQGPNEQTRALLFLSTASSSGDIGQGPSHPNNHSPATLVNELPGPSPSTPTHSWTPDQFRAFDPYFRHRPRRRWTGTVEEGGGNPDISRPWVGPVAFFPIPRSPPTATRNSGTSLSGEDGESLDQAQQAATTSGQRSDSPYSGLETPTPTEEKDHVPTIWFFYSQLFLIFQMGLPAYYFQRVAAIFEDAEFTIDQMKHLVCEDRCFVLLERNRCTCSRPPPAYYRLTENWADFIDAVLREWKTLNLVSVLLLTAIVATLQIEPAFLNPVVYFTGLFSLVCSLLSLVFGCLYILRFNRMRAPHKAIGWAQETQRKDLTLGWVFWNVWLMLALPAIWLVWSLLFYIICIILFVWRLRTRSSSGDVPQLITAARVCVSLVLAIGIAYLVLVVRKFIKFSSNDKFRAYFKEWMALKQKSAASVVIESSNSILPSGKISHQARQETIELSSSVFQPGHGQGAPRPLDHNPNANVVNGGELSNNVRGWRAPSHVQSPPRECMPPEQWGGPARITSGQAVNSPIPSIDIELTHQASLNFLLHTDSAIGQGLLLYLRFVAPMSSKMDIE